MGAGYEPVPAKDVEDAKQGDVMTVVRAVPCRRFTKRAVRGAILGTLALIAAAGLLLRGCHHFHRHGPMDPAEIRQKLVFSEVVGNSLQTYYSAPSAYAEGIQCLECVQKEVEILFAMTQSSIDDACASDVSPALAPFCDFHADNKDMSPLIAFSKAGSDLIQPALAKCAATGPCSVKADAPLDAELEKSPLMRLVGAFPHGPADEVFRSSHRVGTFVQESSDATSCQDCLGKGLDAARQVADEFFDDACSAPVAPRHVKDMCEVALKYPFLAKTTLLLYAQPWDRALMACTMMHSCTPPLPPRPPMTTKAAKDGELEEVALEGAELKDASKKMPFLPCNRLGAAHGPHLAHGSHLGPFRHPHHHHGAKGMMPMLQGMRRFPFPGEEPHTKAVMSVEVNANGQMEEGEKMETENVEETEMHFNKQFNHKKGPRRGMQP